MVSIHKIIKIITISMVAPNIFMTIIFNIKNNNNTNNNVSLYRKNAILQPNVNFDLNEWQIYPMNYCENLGSLQSKDVVLKEENSKTLIKFLDTVSV